MLNGNFTDPRDKEKLIPTILGLWGTVLRNRRLKNDKVGSYDLVHANYNEVFPPELFADLLPDRREAVEHPGPVCTATQPQEKGSHRGRFGRTSWATR